MDRLTFEGNFCDISLCPHTPGGIYCEDKDCIQKQAWERLKAYEDAQEDEPFVVTSAQVAKNAIAWPDPNAMHIQLDPGAYMPTRAHEDDAGLDLYAIETQTVPAHGSAIFQTGVHVQLPYCTAGMLKSKSGLNVKHDLTSDGMIDESYTGGIVVKLYNHGNTDYHVEKGDKISQLVIVPIMRPKLEAVSHLDETERGSNGFGSSGR